VQSVTTVPEGDHIFSFEFMPTGKADIANGKGVRANIELLVDGIELRCAHVTIVNEPPRMPQALLDFRS
jgi:arylsulfatase